MSGELTATQRRLLMLPLVLIGLAFAAHGAEDALPLWRAQARDLAIVLGVAVIIATLLAGARIWRERHA